MSLSTFQEIRKESINELLKTCGVFFAFSKQKFEENNWPKLQDFYIAIISSVVLYFAHQALHALTYDFWLSNIKEKKSKELDHMRALKCV
jgi:hypothetical protein